ncbi:hypothetical protein HA075_16375 [bacterium BFN5]|nr:hypothetical protein HA075_16375 [bacterium BFN5]
MELKYFFLIISVIYFIFDFFNKAKTQHQEPPIPEPHQSDPVLNDIPKKNPLPVLKQKPVVASTATAPAPVSSSVKAKLQSAPQPVQQESAWEDKLEPSLVVNGFIFAEILQPPRARRPLETRFGRRR